MEEHLFDGRGNPSIRLTIEATTTLLMEFSQHTYLILSYINVNNSRSWNKKLSSLRCAKVNFLDSLTDEPGRQEPRPPTLDGRGGHGRRQGRPALLQLAS